MIDPVAAGLPEGLPADVEAATGARIAGVRMRGGGGASREGAELDLVYPDGRPVRAYMNFDVNKAGAGDDAGFVREAAIVRALSGPLADAGVRTAPFLAAIPAARALLGGFVAGEADFNRLSDPVQRSAVAGDFMAQLARLHAIDVTAHPIAGMGPVESPRAVIEARLAALRADSTPDPLIRLAITWLAANIPADLPDPVIVHGDAGPANFLYAEGRVRALLDWELVHYGDPMADLAMLCLRMLFQPFVPLREAFAAYRDAGGQPLDRDRIVYWRVLFQTGFARRARYDDPAAPPPPNLGMNMVYNAIHRRVLAEALAEAANVALDPIELPDAPPGAHGRAFAIALDDLRDTIVPRIADQQAAAKAKGLARLIKWWRDSERHGPALMADDQAAIGAALGRTFPDPNTAWYAFGAAVHAETLPFSTAIRLCHGHVAREAALMADAMGALATARLPDLKY